MKIRKSPIPPNAAAARIPRIDYSDCYQAQPPGSEPLLPARLTAAFWTTMPGWLDLLLRMRNLLVKPLGLKTGEDGNRERIREALEEGRGYGFMSVVANTESEMVVSIDDKHLTAFFSVCIRGRKVHMTTLVRYHNNTGRIYFALIRPFHAFIVKSQMRNILRGQA